jgi:hypothetical protein
MVYSGVSEISEFWLIEANSVEKLEKENQEHTKEREVV